MPADGHSGGGYGFVSEMYWNREHGIGGVMLTNSYAHDLSGTVVETLAGEAGRAPQRTDRPAFATPAVEVLDRIRGTYVGRGTNLVFEVQDRELVLRAGDNRLRVEFVGADEALLPGANGGRVRFEPDQVVSIADGSCWILNHRPGDADGPDEARWHDFEGDYAVDCPRSIPPVAFAVRRGRPCWRWTDGLWLRMREHEHGLFFTCHGEALDLRPPNASYASIKLRKV